MEVHHDSVLEEMLVSLQGNMQAELQEQCVWLLLQEVL